MARGIDFSPIIIIKEKDGTVNTALVVDNGPELMEETGEGKQYTELFQEMIERFPSVLTATFYDKRYTSYRIKVEGENVIDIVNIKRFLLDED